MVCLETNGLSHRFGRGEAVLRDVALSVSEGSIYGFLGPNGAGKTTALRLVLGLLRKQQGTISIFGGELESDRIGILRRTGALIEGPSLYAHLSAEENLVLLQRVRRQHRSRVLATLDAVGLGATGNKRVGQFSLGMKQRLGIAAAILHRPALLILDEPTNGLDPNGIVAMRDLLITLNRSEGTTIVVSSHLLAEVDRLVSHVGVLHGGRLLFQGSLDAFRLQGAALAPVSLRTDDDRRALALLQEAGIDARAGDAGIVLPAMADAALAGINRRLVERGVGVHGLGSVRGDLESIFMRLIDGRAA